MGDWLRGYRRGAAERCTGCRGVSPAPAFAGLYLPTRDAGAEERGRYAWMGYPARGAPVHPRPVPGPRFEIAFVFTIFRCMWLLFSVCGSCLLFLRRSKEFYRTNSLSQQTGSTEHRGADWRVLALKNFKLSSRRKAFHRQEGERREWDDREVA